MSLLHLAVSLEKPMTTAQNTKTGVRLAGMVRDKMKTTQPLSSTRIPGQRRFNLGLAILAWLGCACLSAAAPSLVSTASLDGQTVGLYFAGALDPVSSTTTANYTIAGATIQSATLLADNRTVLLSVQGLTGATYAVSATNLQDAQGNAGNVSGTGSILGWTVQDIGNLPSPSLAYAVTPDALEVRVDGGAIWFTADAGNLITQSKTGDFDVRVQVSKVSGGDANSNMILDARESAEPGSRHVAITVYPTQKNWTAFRRVDADGASSVLAGNWRIAWPAGIDFPNAWLRLKRSGNSFTTYGSTNGLDWIQIGDAFAPDPPYPDAILVGLATAVTDAGQPPVQVEYRNFGNFALTNAVVVITTQPQNVTTTENHAVTFTVGATLQNGPVGALTYQWQRNGVDIAGATGTSFTLTLPTMADQGAQFGVKVSAPGAAPVLSNAAILTVQKDTQPPAVVSTAGLAGSSIGLLFNELLESTSAADPSRYTLIGGIAVDAATLLEDQQTVVLQVTGLTGTSYTLGINGVKDLAGNAASLSATGQVLNYTSQDIGNLPAPSLVYTVTPDVLEVRVDGGAIWFTADAGNLITQSKTGDFDVRVQVSKVSGGDANSNMILDARESADPGSRHVAITVYPTQRNWTSFRRVDTEGASSVLDGNWRIAWPAGIDFPNAWLRLKRNGNSFTTYGSTNGLDWIQIGNAFAPVPPYPDTILVGMATAVTDAGQPPVQIEYRNFGNFALTNAVVVITSQPQSVTTIENHAVTFTVGATLQNGPVGALTYQWQKNGVDLPGATGANYVLQLPAMTDQGAQFSVMVSAPGANTVISQTATLTVQADTVPPKALSTFALVTTMVGLYFDEILDPNSANDTSRYSINTGEPVQSAQLQSDGQTVVLLVSPLSNPQYRVAFNGIADLKGNLSTNTIAGTNAGLAFLDVGNVTEPGLVITRDASRYTVVAGGADIWGLEDSFNFLYQSLTGDFDLRLQLDSATLINPATRGGLMAREDTTPGSRNVFVGTYPKTGDDHWVSTVRPAAGANTVIIPNGYQLRDPSFDFPNAWFRLQRSGETFTTYYSTNGADWVQLGDSVTPDTQYPSTILAGIASSSIDNGAGRSARFDYSHYGPTPAVVVSPQIQIAAAGQNAVISWPTEAVGFQLQQTPQLGAAAAWTSVTNAPVPAGNLQQVTVPIAGTSRFYRLAR